MKKNLNVEWVSLDEIKPYEKNYRVNDHVVDEVLASIEEFGWTQPIVVRKQDKTIAAGHTRFKAAQKAGHKEVPVYFAELSEDQFKAYLLLDNKVASKATNDLDAVAQILEELVGTDYLDMTGYDEDEIEALTDSTDIDDMLEEQDMPSAAPSTGQKSHVKMVQLFLDDVTFPKFIEMAETIQTYMTTDNLTDTVYNAVERVYDEISNKLG